MICTDCGAYGCVTDHSLETGTHIAGTDAHDSDPYWF